MKAPYKNAIRSRKLLREALISLLSKKQISDISVTEIVELAGINRGTFYNHYNNPLDILDEIREELTEKLSLVLSTISKNSNIDELLDKINEYFLENEEDYRVIVKAIPYSAVEKMKHNFIEEITKINLHGISPVSIYFVVNGLIGLYLDYLKNNLPFTYSDIIKSTKTIVHKLFD